MPQRARLQRLTGSAVRVARTPIARLAGRGLALAFVAYLGVRLLQLWRRDHVDLHRVDAGFATLAVAASVVAVASYGVVWLFVLRRLGVVAPLRWMTVFFKSQLGKYIPGSVWQYAGRVGMARQYGLSVGVGLVSLGVEVIASVVAAGVGGLLVVAWLLALASVVLLVVPGFVVRERAAVLAGRLAAALRVDVGVLRDAIRVTPVAAVLYLLVWLAYGMAFWLTARALFHVPARDIAFYVGVFALGWLSGFAAVFAPGGVGVREAVMVALLTSRLGEGNAIVLAASSRIVLTAVDLAAGGLSMLASFRPRGGAEPLPGGRR